MLSTVCGIGPEQFSILYDIESTCSDLNSDGTINILDIVLLIEIILE